MSKLDEFFEILNKNVRWYNEWNGEYPTHMAINPSIMPRLSRSEGFYSRPELGTEVTPHAPVVRKFKLDECTVTIVEDFNEDFISFWKR